MSELLVLFACLNNVGCSETSSQYYVQHKELQEFVAKEERQIKEEAPILTQYVLPILGIGLGREASIRLSTRFYLTGQLTRQQLVFKQEF